MFSHGNALSRTDARDSVEDDEYSNVIQLNAYVNGRTSEVAKNGVVTLETSRVDIIAELLANKRNENTKRAYESGLVKFFGGYPTPGEVWAFLAQEPHAIAVALTRYKSSLIAEGLAEATINRYLAPVRTMLLYAYRAGYCKTSGRGLVDSEKVRSYRDVDGPSEEQIVELLQLPEKRYCEKKGKDSLPALRDASMLHLLYENGLRRAEVCKLNVSHFSLPGRRLSILGKGRGTQREFVPLDVRTAKLIGLYLTKAGHSHESDGALFRNFDHRPSKTGGRLTEDALYKIVKSYGLEINIVGLRPHKLRHSTGTHLARATNGNMNIVQEVMRHSDIRTSSIYVRNAADEKGKATTLLANIARGKKNK